MSHSVERKDLRLAAWVCVSVFASLSLFFGLFWLLPAVGGQLLPSRSFHLRGQFDRVTYRIRDCTSGQIYRLILTSGGAYRLFALEDQLKPTDGDTLIIEFDAHTIPPKLPWDRYDTVGAHSDLSLVRGTCDDAPAQP